MDADLQHDERLLSEMLSVLQLGKADLVIGSRYASGGGANGFSALRESISRVATQWGRRLSPGRRTRPHERLLHDAPRPPRPDCAGTVESEGFKILFDILTTAGRRKLSIVEIPYGFRARLNGSSKFDLRIALEFVALVLAKLTHQTVPQQFFSFLAVGGSGVVVQLFCLSEGLNAGLTFAGTQSAQRSRR